MKFYYFKKEWGRRAKRLLGKKTVPMRYTQMYQEITKTKPSTILEIGTNDGMNAVRMMKLAGHASQYYGFDLFEDLDEADYSREFALRVPSKDEVELYLRKRGVRVALLQAGDSRVTLSKTSIPKMDFIFIDGGHSEETVSSDWDNCQRLMHEHTIVFFDDYPRWGIGPVVDAIDRKRFDVSITTEFDEFPDIFSDSRELVPFHLARVSRRESSLGL